METIVPPYELETQSQMGQDDDYVRQVMYEPDYVIEMDEKNVYHLREL